MQLKYLFINVSLYIFGLVAISKSASTVEKMNTLLSRPIWLAIARDNPSSGPTGGGVLSRVGQLIEPDEEGFIVNESNLSYKIQQYFTLMSWTYGHRLYEIVFYFRYVNEKFRSLQLQLEYFPALKQQMRNYEPVMSMMKGSLELIIEMVDQNDQPIGNVEIIRAIDSILRDYSRSNCVTDFMAIVERTAQLIETFILANRTPGVVGNTVRLKGNFAQQVINSVDIAFSYFPPINSVQINLQAYINTRVEDFITNFNLFGFGYSSRRRTVYVQMNSALSSILTNLGNFSFSVGYVLLDEE